MKSRHWLWTMIFLSAICAATITTLSFNQKSKSSVFVVQDALDPLAAVLQPYVDNGVERLNPYRLGHVLPGLDGMAFVFSTQARPYQNSSESAGYVPLYSATIVIAVNKNGNAAGVIDGWQTLLESKAVVLFPHNGTEGGRLATIALARGLQAEEGDFTPALDALAGLYTQGRLNRQDEYGYDGYNYMFHPERLREYDAVVLWDYQAKTLSQMFGEWDIVIPVEGAFTANCGFVYGGLANAPLGLHKLQAFLLSEEGRQALTAAGFSPLTEEADLSVWDTARLTYNPSFRRAVLSVKLHAPASVLERTFLQSGVLLLFGIVAQRVIRRIPAGSRRTASLYGMLFAALWLLIGIAKTLTFYHTSARYLWFATYIPRHFLPLCWYAMCYANRYKKFPPRKTLISLSFAALFLCLFVFTNDMHRQIFAYTYENPGTWGNNYTNGWGYYLSLFWSLCLCVCGLRHILRNKMTRRQKLQMLYAGIFFVLLFAYQGLYVVGVRYVIDFDIPTIVALSILAFSLAAQQERFMGASLLDLPIFQHSPYAISIFDSSGKVEYRNRIMMSLDSGDMNVPSVTREYNALQEVVFGQLTYQPYTFSFDTGQALVLEDITELKRLESALRQTQKKLKAVGTLLILQAEKTENLAGSLERARYSRHMDTLFLGKIIKARQYLEALVRNGYRDDARLSRVRFLISICQRRLRFILRSLEEQPPLSAGLIAQYAAGVVQDGRRFGLDGVATSFSGGTVPADFVAALLEYVDQICLYAVDSPGSSLICHLDATRSGIALDATLSWEEFPPSTRVDILSSEYMDTVSSLGGALVLDTEDDGLSVRLRFPIEEVQI